MNTHTVMLLAMLVFLHLPLSGNGEMQIPAGVSLPPMPSLVPTSETVLAQQKRQDGIELMQLMSVSDGDAILHYSDWSFPTSIVVNAVRYLVETGLVNTFDIVLADNCHSNVADGYVGIKENEKEARIAAFAEMGSGSIAINQYRNPYVFSSPLTGLWRLGLTNHVEWTHEAFVSRNVAIIIRTATNGMDFAASLLNAGLPENERIPLPSAP